MRATKVVLTVKL